MNGRLATALRLLCALLLLLAAAAVSCTCDGKAVVDDDDANDDADDDNDTDDDTEEEWHIYTIDPDKSNLHTSIAVDLGNKVHISYYDEWGGDWGLMYATNKSGAWQIFQIDDVGMYTSIAVASDDKVHISYYDHHNQLIKYATNSSGSWQTYAVALVGTPGPTQTGYNDLALDSAGNVHIVYHFCNINETTDCFDDHLSYVTNAYGGWQQFILDPNEGTGEYPSVAVDPGDRLHIVYRGLKYATNASGSWEIFYLDGGSRPSIAVDASGAVHISYESRDQLKYATNASGSWKVYTLGPGGPPDIALDSAGNPHIAYPDSGKLMYATNRSGKWEFVKLDGDRCCYTSIAVDSDDYVHISYRGANGELKYATNRPPED